MIDRLLLKELNIPWARKIVEGLRYLPCSQSVPLQSPEAHMRGWSLALPGGAPRPKQKLQLNPVGWLCRRF